MLIKSKKVGIHIPDSFASAGGYNALNKEGDNNTSDLFAAIHKTLAPMAIKRDEQIGNEKANAAITEAMSQNSFVDPGESGLFDLGRGAAYKERTEKYNSYVADTMIESFYSMASREAAIPKFRTTALLNFGDNIEKIVSKVDDMGGTSEYKDALKNNIRQVGFRKAKQLADDIDLIEQKENTESVRLTLSERLTNLTDPNNGATSVAGYNAQVNLIEREQGFLFNETGTLIDASKELLIFRNNTFDNIKTGIVLEAEKDTQVFINDEGNIDTEKLGASIDGALERYGNVADTLGIQLSDEDKAGFRSDLILGLFTANTRSLFEGPFSSQDMTTIYDDETFKLKMQEVKEANEMMRQEYLSLFGKDIKAGAQFLTDSEKLGNAMESEIKGRFLTAKTEAKEKRNAEEIEVRADYKTAKRNIESAFSQNKIPADDDMAFIKAVADGSVQYFSESQIATARDLYYNVYRPKQNAVDVVLNKTPNADRSSVLSILQDSAISSPNPGGFLNDGQVQAAQEQVNQIFDADADKGKTANRIELAGNFTSPTFSDSLVNSDGNHITAFTHFVAQRAALNGGVFYAKEGDTAALETALAGIQDPELKSRFMLSILGNGAFMGSIRELNLEGDSFFGSVAFAKDLGISETENYVNPDVLKNYRTNTDVTALLREYENDIMATFLEGGNAPGQYGKALINMALRKQASKDPAKWDETFDGLENDLKLLAKGMPIIGGVIVEDFKQYVGAFDFIRATQEHIDNPPQDYVMRRGFEAPVLVKQPAPEHSTPFITFIDTPEELVGGEIKSFVDNTDVPEDMLASIGTQLSDGNYQLKYESTGAGYTKYVGVDPNGDLLQYESKGADGKVVNKLITFTVRPPSYYLEMKKGKE